MTKIRSLLLILVCGAMFVTSSQAQIFFTQDFQGAVVSATRLPASWTESGLSTDTMFYVGNNLQANAGGYWPVPAHTLFAQSNDDVCNCDKSVDRLIMPSQNFSAITGGLQLIADLYQDGAYGNGGSVDVSTNGGTTWTTIYTIPANAAWQDNTTISLNAYIGMTAVLIAFHENDNGGWATGLGVDNVRLNQVPPSTDASLSACDPNQYTIAPLSQTAAYPVTATVSNPGTNTITTANVVTKIYLAPNFTIPVQTLNGSTTNLAAGGSAVVAMGNVTPPLVGGYLFEHIVTAVGDANTSNDTLRFSMTVSDSTYARDNGTAAAAIGVNGAGNTAILGNVYNIRANTTLSSVLFATNGIGAGPAVGDTTQVLIYATTAGVPTGAPIATSAYYIYTATDTGAVVRTVAINGAAGLAVTAGNKYFVGIKEFSRTGNLGIIVSSAIFTANSTYAQVNGGAWTALEGFGFPNPALVRANFRSSCTVAASASSTNATCTATNGSATATASGGTIPYSYVWSNAATTATANNLAAGSYSVTVTDGTGCSVSQSVTVSTTSTTLTATNNTTDSNCGAATGSATATPTNGTAPYTYMWSNAGTTQTINNISAGNYSVTIGDANGCSGVISGIVVANPNAPTASITAFSSVACNGGNTGSATVTASAGTAPYTFMWSNTSTTASVTGLTAGVYNVTVTDANSCAASTNVTISEPAALTATTNAAATMDVACNGGTDGMAGVTAGGGTSPYSYMWSNSATTANITGLTAGTYSVTVTDANSCTQNMSVTVSEPAVALTAPTSGATNVSCNAGSNGSVAVTATGGTSPYSYTWSNGAITATASGLTAGTYDVTITDANGCIATSAPVIITEPTAISSSSTATDASIAGSSDGAVDVTVSGGTSPYTFVWSNGATTEDISGVVAGTYTVTITDDNGCTNVISTVVDDGPIAVGLTNGNININVFPNPVADKAILSVDLKNMSEVNIQISNVTGQVIYSLNAGNINNKQFDLNMSEWASGVYFVRVTAGNDTVTYRLTKK